MSLEKFSDRLGDWNPQLLREINGRFTSNSLTFILIASAIVQVLGGLWLVNGSPSEQRFVSGFQFLNWFLPIGAIFSGMYSLISDLNRERKSGTFDFIKSSPQSGSSIFLGKLIGVPSLVYLVILSIVPLHLGLALLSGASLGLMLLWYLTIGTIGYFCLVVTSLYALFGGKFAIVYALLFSQPISAILGLYNHYLSSVISENSWFTTKAGVSWFYLPVTHNIWLFYIFTCCTLLTIASWLWTTIDRKYIDLTATTIEKKDSYIINIIFQLWLVGFVLPLMSSTAREGNFVMLSIFQTIGIVWLICLIPAILPSRRSLRSWIYSWQQKYADRQRFNWRDPELVRELIWDDRSPTFLAMGINLAIAASIWGVLAIGVLVLSPNVDLFTKFIVGVTIASILTLIYTVAVHLQCLRSQLRNSEVIPVIFLMSLLPLMCGFLLITGWSSSQIHTSIGQMLLLFSPFFWVGMAQLSYPAIALTAIAQLGILIGSLKVLKHQLLKFGELKMSPLSQQQFIKERSSS